MAASGQFLVAADNVDQNQTSPRPLTLIPRRSRRDGMARQRTRQQGTVKTLEHAVRHRYFVARQGEYLADLSGKGRARFHLSLRLP